MHELGSLLIRQFVARGQIVKDTCACADLAPFHRDVTSMAAFTGETLL